MAFDGQRMAVSDHLAAVAGSWVSDFECKRLLFLGSMKAPFFTSISALNS